MQLTGRSGELVEGLFVASGKDSKKFELVVKQLEGFVAAIESAGLVVDRFFATTNYSEDECRAVLELLTSDKEPLKSFESIKDADVREVIVDNEGNMDGAHGCSGSGSSGWRALSGGGGGQGARAPCTRRCRPRDAV